jgi:predicted Rossmann fold nucleotide-binding protein DprA/Smf involved in DNA uptake
LTQANEVVYVGQEYSRDCMLERNRWLVEYSSILLAVYNGTLRSGTGATVRYALKQGREVIVIDPISRNILRQGFPASE